MAPLAEPPQPNLAGAPVLILSGLNDPIAPRSSADKLTAALAAAGARVERDDLPAGHGLTHADVTRSKAFYTREAAQRS
jgi:phospholipase/carboxylesterase